ncbi:hypothetical protein HPB47_012255 [Ixodes persulcatus]|uniref:Uncharacterized protein n=1 Tax=Ixodes persulcatus TaxID=34615 RepID=A0AC60NUA8_IXOPE|nr:hypothetical protein HPB47_012255 [Ixodes persulcatus]
MAAASKRAGCQELQMWVKATTNHLYYSAKAGAGDRKLTVDVWLSFQNPAINEHTGHGGSYPRCLQNEIPESTRNNKHCRSLDEVAMTTKHIVLAPMNAAFTRPSKRELALAKRSQFGQATP